MEVTTTSIQPGLPPATAKSLFLESLGSPAGGQYPLGGSSNRAGIAFFLLEVRPRYLVIDKLDKTMREDFSVLLSLMKRGIAARMKKAIRCRSSSGRRG
ncbi:MAG: hypothetical protein ACE5JL_06285 [Dehalococcoidia bacterium]